MQIRLISKKFTLKLSAHTFTPMSTSRPPDLTHMKNYTRLFPFLLLALNQTFEKGGNMNIVHTSYFTSCVAKKTVPYLYLYHKRFLRLQTYTGSHEHHSYPVTSLYLFGLSFIFSVTDPAPPALPEVPAPLHDPPGPLHGPPVPARPTGRHTCAELYFYTTQLHCACTSIEASRLCSFFTIYGKTSVLHS